MPVKISLYGLFRLFSQHWTDKTAEEVCVVLAMKQEVCHFSWKSVNCTNQGYSSIWPAIINPLKTYCTSKILFPVYSSSLNSSDCWLRLVTQFTALLKVCFLTTYRWHHVPHHLHLYTLFMLHPVAHLNPITAPTAVYTQFLFPESLTHLVSAASQLCCVTFQYWLLGNRASKK